MRPVKSLLVIASFITAIIVCVAATTPSGLPDDKRNLKVLPENISRDSLHKIMEDYNKALGVKCGFCHAQKDDGSNKLDFASDNKKEKEIARHMITMTNDLNKTFFNYMGSTQPDTIRAVTCNTCHRGEIHPAK